MEVYPEAPANPTLTYDTYTGKMKGYFTGMNIRTQIASMAMQGMLANSYDNGVVQPLSACDYEDIARYAVAQADALIAELNK